MVTASLRGVSASEAEHVLATVWRRAEEYGVEPPRLGFGFRPDGGVTIRFTFADPVNAALILDGLGTSGVAAPLPPRKKPRRRSAVGAGAWCAVQSGG